MKFLMNPFYFLTMSILLFSSIMAMSSSNWIMMWAALELNLISFIPMMVNSKFFQETEATVKYFLTQALGSSMLLMSSMSLWFMFSIPKTMITLIILMSLLLKMGMSPCHMWYPSVMMSISWINALLLSTWQKLAPLMITSYMMFSTITSHFMLQLAALNAIIGGLIGLNQTHLRAIMAYSSITHMGWMMALMSINKPILVLMYFILYSLVIMPIFIMLHIKNITNSNNINKLISSNYMYQFIIPLLLLSLSGIPPLTGFMPKWITISTLSMNFPSLTMILIMGTMMNSYYYLNITFNFMLNNKLLMSSSNLTSPINMPMVLASCTLLIIPLYML